MISPLTVFLGLYLLGALIYWISYILLRPHISRSHKHLVLFLGNMVLGFFLVTYLPISLYLNGELSHPIVLFITLCMTLSLAFHHFGFLKDIQPWRGFITPRGEKVPLIHGAISHLLCSISYGSYGLVFFFYYSQKTNNITEKFFLYALIFWVELVAFIVLFDGIRMWYSRKS